MSEGVRRRALWIERADLDGWMPPWVRRQSTARYRWASRYVRGRCVLDAACGTGYGSLLLRIQGAARLVIGMDLEPESVQTAAERTRKTDGVRFCRGDVLALPFDSGSFDVYVSFETIEHVPDPRRLLEEAWRILRPGGRLLLSTPNRLVTNPGLSADGRPLNPFHVREFAPEELEELLGTRWSRVELWGMSLFPAAYLRLLNACPAGWHRVTARLNQAIKLPLELLRTYPSARPTRCAAIDARRAEYLLLTCVKPRQHAAGGETVRPSRPRIAA